MLNRRSGVIAAALVLVLVSVLAAAIAADSSSPPASKPSAPASSAKASGSKPAASGTATAGQKPAAQSGFMPLGHMATITRGDLKFDAYVVVPKELARASVIVIQEWWGLNDQIKSVADELSHKGFVAIAPDLYHGKVTTDPNVAGELLKALPTDRALNELSATYAHLRSMASVGNRPIGSIGFCMGGGLSLRLAMREPELRACVACYGRPETDPAKLQPMNASVLGIYGGKDTGIPTSLVEEFRKTMESIGKNATIKIYPDAGHGFMNPNNPTYRPDDAKDAWARIDAFFGEYLKPPLGKLKGDVKEGKLPGEP